MARRCHARDAEEFTVTQEEIRWALTFLLRTVTRGPLEEAWLEHLVTRLRDSLPPTSDIHR